MALDEVQRVSDIFFPIKKLVDEKKMYIPITPQNAVFVVKIL